MPSSDFRLIAGPALIMLAVVSWPARADTELANWPLTPPVEEGTEKGPMVTPLEFARIHQTANDREPEYASADQLALIEAARKGDRPGLAKLLKQGVNPNAKPDLWGKTALIVAVERNDVEMVRLLLDSGADPDLLAGGYTPLGRAAFLGYDHVAALLLKYGADPDFKSKDGNTPLTAAASMNRLEVIRVLIPAHPDYTLFNREGRTALSVAAMRGYIDAVRLMLDAGVDPNVPNNTGSTALVAAGIDHHEDIQTLLVHHGAEAR
jgi:ankyrin repeat protein